MVVNVKSKKYNIQLVLSIFLCLTISSMLLLYPFSSVANNLPVGPLSAFIQCLIQNNTAVRAARANVKAAEARYIASAQN